jgi:PAS domain S-box-containing protein
MADTPRRTTGSGNVTTPRRAASDSEHAPRDPAAVAYADRIGLSAQERSDLYQLLIQSVRDYAIFLLDPTGRVMTWNPGAERFNGYTTDEILGHHFSIFYPAEDVAAGKPAWELEVAAREGRLEDEGWRLRKDGTPFWSNVIITALRDPTGTLVGFAKVTRDLTERRAAEQRAIADARRLAVAEAANRAKAEFLASMSHELRTPLNAIAGYADLLAAGIGGPVSAQQREYLQRIRGSQQHLLAIINDILNFSRLEAGQLSYQLAPMSLGAVIDAVLPMMTPLATAKELRLERVPGPDVTAHADRARVEQILVNLLSNAVKFTESGGRIEVGCEALADRAALRVRDSGSGIDPGNLESIFEPFVQVGRSLSTPHEGTGLGLAISRDLARAMGGDLTADSVPGEGATFTLTLPLG